MQTNSLPIQLNNTGPAPAQRNGAPNGANGDAGQFSAMLNNELASRQQPPAPALPPAPAPKTETPKPQAARTEDADKPAQPDGAAPQQASRAEDANKPAQADKGDADQDEQAGAEADTDAGAQSAAAGDPASAMLALMASLQTPAQDPAAAAGKAAAQAFDALGGATRGKRGDAAQLASLQATIKSAGKDGAADGGKGFPGVGAAGLRDATLATTGARILGEAGQDAPAADAAGKQAVEAGDKLGADLRAMLAGSGKAQGQAEMQLDAAELSLRQARDAAAAQQQPVAAAAALSQAQPAMIEAAEAAAAESLSARVGTDAWENQVGQKVVWMVGSEEQTASLTLNPPDLGPLQVVLSVSNDQASVSFSANQEEVRHALENALPRLREMMSESGITLGNASVSAGMPDGRQAQDGGRNSGGFGQGNGQNHNGRGDAIAAGEASVRPAARTTMLGDRGMVDTFA